MTFEEAWKYLENHKKFEVKRERKYKDFPVELRSLLGERGDNEIISATYNVFGKELQVSYCEIDKLICVTAFQPKIVNDVLQADMEKEIYSAECNTFEECIIDLARQLEVSD